MIRTENEVEAYRCTDVKKTVLGLYARWATGQLKYYSPAQYAFS